jgi:hypothetical protein
MMYIFKEVMGWVQLAPSLRGGLRIAFVIFGLAGLMLIPISQLLFRQQKLNT